MPIRKRGSELARHNISVTDNTVDFGARTLTVASGGTDAADAATARANLGAAVQNTVGDFKHSAATANHGAWLLCNGQAISRTTYAALFTLIGTAFGNGNGSTTFTLPDFRGRVFGAIGQGSGLTNRALGAKVGAETHTLTENEMPSHNHSVSNSEIDSTDSGTRFQNTSSTSGSISMSTNNAGGGQAHNNMQPTLFGGNVFIYSGVTAA